MKSTQMVYPDGRELNYAYGTANGTNDVASRIESLIDNDGTTHLVDYEFLGIDTFVETDYLQPDVRNRLFDPAGSGDIYTSLDRFGRQVNCQWEDYGSSADLAQIKYGYDRAGNRLWREDVVAASKAATQRVGSRSRGGIFMKSADTTRTCGATDTTTST